MRHELTLVELLTVNAFVIALLLPTLSKAREASKSIFYLSNVRQLRLGLLSYATNSCVTPGAKDHGDLDWSGYTSSKPADSSEGDDFVPFGRRFPDVSRSEMIYLCPLARRQAKKFNDYAMVCGMVGAVRFGVADESPVAARKGQ